MSTDLFDTKMEAAAEVLVADGSKGDDAPEEPPPLPPPVDSPPPIDKEEGEWTDLGQRALLFAEFFAGTGVLTAEVKKSGTEVRDPDDVSTRGTDFLNPNTIEKVKTWIGTKISSGYKVMIHLPPPCATFSRA